MNEDNITLLRGRIQDMLNEIKDKFSTWPDDKFTKSQLSLAFESFFDKLEKDKAVFPQTLVRGFAMVGEEIHAETSFFSRYDPSTKIDVKIQFKLNRPTFSGEPPKRFFRKLRIMA